MSSGNLKALQSAYVAIKETDISIICVGTPSKKNGGLNLDYIKSVCEEIGTAIKKKDSHHIIVMRSTVLPGTADDIGWYRYFHEYYRYRAGTNQRRRHDERPDERHLPE